MTENDLAQRLRGRAYSGLPDPLSEQAADEIERLRLTDAEREAIQHFIDGGPDDVVSEPPHLAVLERLLDRMKGDNHAV
jgi:hypothetical protein